GRERAAILVASVEMRPGLASLFRQAISEAGETPVGVHARMGLAEQLVVAGGWGEAVELSRGAVALARRLGDRALLGAALTYLGIAELADSRPEGAQKITEALAIERELGGLPTSVFHSPRTYTGLELLTRDDPHGARPFLEERLATASERGDD